MKKFFPYIFILVILVGLFMPTQEVNAGWWDGVLNPDILLIELFSVVTNGILTFMSWFAGFAGLILNYVLDFTIVNMKLNVIGGTDAGGNVVQGLTGINIAWKIIKDLMNIAFIFLLVYEGIKLIIGVGSREKIKSFIAMIVLASLLINFSLFFTKVMIDASNILTIGVYDAVTTNSTTGQKVSVATIILSKLQLQTIYDPAANPDLTAGGFGGLIIFTVGTSAIFLMTTFVLFAITFLFITRYIVLIILLMLSPIAFMGMALDFIKPYSKQWWDALTGQLLFAPVFMVMLMISITLMGSPNFTNPGSFAGIFTSGNINITGGTTGGVTASGGSAMGLILNFAVIIGLLLASIILAKSTASKGSSLIGGATGKMTAFAGGAIMGGAGALGRRTIGAAALRGTSAEELEVKAAAGDKGARARLALAKGSWDVRRSKVGELVSSATGVNLGKGIPFNDKAGEGGQAGTISRSDQKSEKEIDVVMKAYRSKPAELARYISTRSDSDQKYVYDKLSARDRAALDDELDKRQFGATILPSQRGKNTITAKLRSGLSTDEREKTIKASGDANKDKKSRDKISLLKAMSISNIITNATTTGSPIPIDPSTGVPYVMPDDPATGAPYPLTIINPRTAAPYRYDDQELRLTPNEARKLGPESRQDPGVIQKMTPKHLKDLIDSGEMEDAETETIVRTILGIPAPAPIPNPVPPRPGAWLWEYTNQQSQFNYITKPEVAPLFGINV